VTPKVAKANRQAKSWLNIADVFAKTFANVNTAKYARLSDSSQKYSENYYSFCGGLRFTYRPSLAEQFLRFKMIRTSISQI
jgi:hypothetical protein